MRRGRLLAITVTAVLGLVMTIAAAPPSRAAATGVIAAVTSKGSQLPIFTVNVDGTGFTIRVVGSNPTWSPDGTQLAYIAANNHVAIFTGSGLVRTDVPADGAEVFSPSSLVWSPDGARLAFVRHDEIWVMNAVAPYDPVRLTSRPCGDVLPTWSPDGQQIVYNAGCSGTLHVMNVDGTGDHSLLNPLGIPEGWPSWSPDGTTIAFLSDNGGGQGIWLMDADGTNQRFLTPTYEFCCGPPAWSPDSSQVAFVGDGTVLDIISADGTGLTEVPTPGEVFYPSWSPAG